MIRTDTGYCFVADNETPNGNEDLNRKPPLDFYLECEWGIVTMKMVVDQVRTNNSVVSLLDAERNLMLSHISTVECGYYGGKYSCP